MARIQQGRVIFLDRSKASRVEVMECATAMEQEGKLSEILLVMRGTDGNYSFIGAIDEVLHDPARVIGQLEMLKQALLGQLSS